MRRPRADTARAKRPGRRSHLGDAGFGRLRGGGALPAFAADRSRHALPHRPAHRGAYDRAGGFHRPAGNATPAKAPGRHAVRALSRLHQYDRITLMRLNSRRPQEPTILFSKCLPRPPEMANPLFENARIAQERWDADFASALDRALRSAASGGPEPCVADSGRPARSRGGSGFRRPDSQRRLILVSDLLSMIRAVSRFTFRMRILRPGARRPRAGPPIYWASTCASFQSTGRIMRSVKPLLCKAFGRRISRPQRPTA